MSEAKLRAAMARGQRMRELAEGEGGLFEVFAAVKDTYVSELIETDPTDTAEREAIYHRIKALGDIKTTMELVIAEGNGAAQMIDKLTKRNT